MLTLLWGALALTLAALSLALFWGAKMLQRAYRAEMDALSLAAQSEERLIENTRLLARLADVRLQCEGIERVTPEFDLALWERAHLN